VTTRCTLSSLGKIYCTGFLFRIEYRKAYLGAVIEPKLKSYPQMSINGIPINTKYLSISMYDHEYGFDHGGVKIAYDGSNTIVKGSYKDITGPCPPPNGQGRYKITVKAIDENDSI